VRGIFVYAVDCAPPSCRWLYVVVDICRSRHTFYMTSAVDKPIVWLRGEIKTPPFSAAARLETGLLLRRLQQGARLGMPHSRPMPSVGRRCHELRIVDPGKTWRIVYRADPDAIIIADVFQKTTQQTPARVVADCARRLRLYDETTREG
jgi:phage-related protein